MAACSGFCGFVAQPETSRARMMNGPVKVRRNARTFIGLARIRLASPLGARYLREIGGSGKGLLAPPERLPLLLGKFACRHKDICICCSRGKGRSASMD